MSFDDRVENALIRDADYSLKFTQKIADIAIKIASVLNVTYIHDDDMNYKSAQTISFCADLAGANVECNGDAFYKADLLISSKGVFFTFVIYKRLMEHNFRSNQVWQELPLGTVPPPIYDFVEKVKNEMSAYGYELLDVPILTADVQGRLQKLDDLPATVFNILFAER